MTTGLSDQQLQAAFMSARGDLDYMPKNMTDMLNDYRQREALGLRAVADLAITHQEVENHALRSELERAEDQANNLAGDNAELTRRLEELQEK